jgi:pimeloyl-ACP methyl ester carboxylesterase
MRDRWVDLDGPVHYLDFGGPDGGPVVVAVHGLGGSCLNWAAVAPLLTPHCRVLAPDLAGHGLTEARGRGTSVGANQVLLHRFIETVADRPVILVGNSMGGLVALLEAAAEPDAVAGLVLVDAALPLVPARPDPLVTIAFAAYATPGVGRFVLARRRTAPAPAQVALVLRMCCVDPSRVPAPVVAHHVEMIEARAGYADAGRDFLVAARSVLATVTVAGARAYRRRMAAVRAPVLMVHGARDRLVPLRAARAVARRHPSWRLVVLPDAGHVPQLELPAETAAAILDWLAAAGMIDQYTVVP